MSFDAGICRLKHTPWRHTAGSQSATLSLGHRMPKIDAGSLLVGIKSLAVTAPRVSPAAGPRAYLGRTRVEFSPRKTSSHLVCRLASKGRTGRNKFLLETNSIFQPTSADHQHREGKRQLSTENLLRLSDQMCASLFVARFRSMFQVTPRWVYIFFSHRTSLGKCFIGEMIQSSQLNFLHQLVNAIPLVLRRASRCLLPR